MRSTKSCEVYTSSDRNVQKYYFPKILYVSQKGKWQAEISWFGFQTNVVRDILNKARNGYFPREE